MEGRKGILPPPPPPPPMLMDGWAMYKGKISINVVGEWRGWRERVIMDRDLDAARTRWIGRNTNVVKDPL